MIKKYFIITIISSFLLILLIDILLRSKTIFNKSINEDSRLLEISGIQSDYMCIDYLKAQKDKKSKFFVSKMAEGLIIKDGTGIVNQVEGNIAWSGIVSRLIKNGQYQTKYCDPDTLYQKCSQAILNNMYIITLKNPENGKEDNPLFINSKDLPDIEFQIRRKNEYNYQSISIDKLYKQIKVGDKIEIEHILLSNPRFEQTYKININ